MLKPTTIPNLIWRDLDKATEKTMKFAKLLRFLVAPPNKSYQLTLKKKKVLPRGARMLHTEGTLEIIQVNYLMRPNEAKGRTCPKPPSLLASEPDLESWMALCTAYHRD